MFDGFHVWYGNVEMLRTHLRAGHHVDRDAAVRAVVECEDVVARTKRMVRQRRELGQELEDWPWPAMADEWRPTPVDGLVCGAPPPPWADVPPRHRRLYDHSPDVYAAAWRAAAQPRALVFCEGTSGRSTKEVFSTVEALCREVRQIIHPL